MNLTLLTDLSQSLYRLEAVSVSPLPGSGKLRNSSRHFIKNVAFSRCIG